MSIGVYVHLPFCPYLCPYCDFAKWPYRASKADRYLDALVMELATWPRREASTLFLGGGTPNTYEAPRITGLIKRLSEHFPRLDAAHEISIEVNPELVRADDLAAYRDAGVTRVSIGVQSFDDDEIRLLGRRHTARDITKAVNAARRARIPSVSIDLIFAVPGQSAASWQRSLDRAFALDVDHISAYGLTVEQGTPYAALREREPGRFLDDVAEAELYEIAMERLEAAGYEQYEISNFARPGHRCAHNENYWANGEYAGIGVGAASYVDGVRSTHTRSLAAYIEASVAGRPIPGESERLEGAARVGEAIMLALRTSQGVRLGPFNERYGIDVRSTYDSTIREYAAAGLVEHGEDFVRLTRRGRFVANEICAAFLEAPSFA